MISKRITCKVANDNYGRLANYIADASHEGEKSLMSWCSGCWAGEDYELAMQEVKDTQSLNTRTTKEKTYHLVVSFHPEDEAKLTPEMFKAIEEEFAQALGFDEHQRHAGVHQNTANIHMHIAYNMIHPEKLTRHEPYRDYWKRDKVCREIELKYGLTIDNGRDREKEGEEVQLSSIAATIEAQTGQESFEGYAKRLKPEIMPMLEKAENWQDVHELLAKYGITIKPHANGLTLSSLDGKQHLKASAFDRSMSKTKLEKRFGGFEAPEKERDTQPATKTYEKRPLQHNAERDRLYEEYKAGMALRQQHFEKPMNEAALQKDKIYEKWKKRQNFIYKLPMSKFKKKTILTIYRVLQKLEFKRNHINFQKQKVHAKQIFPFTSWNQFLKFQAMEKGNESALAILRSKEEVVEKELQKVKQLAEQQIAKGNKNFEGIRYSIDNKGTLLFTLTNGSSIKDTGKKLWFSNDKTSQEAALLIAQMKWGKRLKLENNSFVFDATPKEKSLAREEALKTKSVDMGM